MSDKQTINDLLMEVAKLRKDADYLKGEVAYWKQQASVTDGCDTESGVTLRDLFGIWKDTSDQLEADSREKLEADIWKKVPVSMSPTYDVIAEVDTVMEWLDRQAAITERECDSVCDTCRHEQVVALQERVDALEEERKNLLREKVESDETCESFARHWEEEKKRRDALEADKRNWQDGYYLAKLTELEEENRLMRESLRSIANDAVTAFGMTLDEVRNLQAENAELREKLSIALGHAHDTVKLDGESV